MQDLFQAIKQASLPAVWAQGVKLGQQDAVSLERESMTELTLRVRSAGRAAYATVTLYPPEREWTCDCGDARDPCAHAIAAAIAANAAKERGAPLRRAADAKSKLVYALRRIPLSGLTLDRFVVSGAKRTRLGGTLAQAVTQFGLEPGPGDLVADRIATAAPRGILRPGAWQALLDALSGAELELEGKKVRASGELALPIARVSDSGPNIELAIEKNPALSEVLDPGLARSGDLLQALGLTELTGLKLERLPLKRVFERSDVGELCARVLPELEAKLPVNIESVNLPRRGRKRVPPRISFELSHEKHALSVLPLIVYGEPTQARVDAGKLVHVAGDLPERDEAAERALIDRLRDELNLVPGRRVDFDGRDADRFAGKLRGFQHAHGSGVRAMVRAYALEPELRVEGDSLFLEFITRDEGGSGPDSGSQAGKRIAADAVLRAYREGLSLVPLEGGGWAPLPADWLARYGDRIAQLLAARDAAGRVPKVATFALAALCEELDRPKPPTFAELAPLIRDFQGLPSASLPEDLRATLRSYQRVGVDWLCFLRDAGLGAVLADDMGLGKTLQTLCALRGRTLIICPKSVVHNWQSEAARFRPALKVAVYQGARRALDATADVTITSYAILRLDAERLASIDWDTVVLDEAQAIKNPDSQVSRSAYALKATFPVALSGTPLENRLEELWSILHFTHRGLLAGRSDFRERHALPIEQGNPEKLAALRQRIKPFILRRLKRDVAPELPPRTDVVLEIELEPQERELYQAIHAATRRDVLEKLEHGGNVLAALEAILRLRQAACHSALVPGQHAEGSSKIEALLENLEQVAAEGHKALVFSQWTSLLDLVEPHLERAGLSFVRLDGSTRDRAGVVATFQSDAGPPVMLTSLKAGGAGLNLTAADHVFLLDPWWNPAVEDQAADRAHRIGQERPVMVYRLIAKDTIEQGIMALQTKKRALSEAALDGTGAAAGITREDLLALLA
ncbi:MAG TPA: DEAD/DEAH box helicase [Polyangiaceae bacterium]